MATPSESRDTRKKKLRDERRHEGLRKPDLMWDLLEALLSPSDRSSRASSAFGRDSQKEPVELRQDASFVPYRSVQQGRFVQLSLVIHS